MTLAGASLVSTSAVSAQQNESPFRSLISRIAEKFNLKTEDVQTVFDEHRQQKMDTMKARFEQRLDQLVNDGKITAAQKKLIMDKKTELMNKKQDLRQQHRVELEKWAKDNNIDLKLLGRFGGKFGMMRGWRAK